MSLHDMVIRLHQELQELKRRQSQMIRRGRVHALRNGGNEMQIKYGEDEDGQPILGPWVPVSGGNGSGGKTRHAYSVGEHVMTFNPDGDWEGAEVHPSNHHQEGQSPSQTQGEHVIHDGGGIRMAIVNGNLSITGGTIKHNGKNIGGDHTHSGVEAGSGKSGGPEA